MFAVRSIALFFFWGCARGTGEFCLVEQVIFFLRKRFGSLRVVFTRCYIGGRMALISYENLLQALTGLLTGPALSAKL
jgi:hypothetical protein